MNQNPKIQEKIAIMRKKEVKGDIAECGDIGKRCETRRTPKSLKGLQNARNKAGKNQKTIPQFFHFVSIFPTLYHFFRYPTP